MKRKIIVFLLFAVGCLGVYTYSTIKTPRMFDVDGRNMWKMKMQVTHNSSMLPAYATRYNVYRNGIAFNDKDINTWVEFIIWNGYGVKNIEVYAVDSGEMIYPNAAQKEYIAREKDFTVVASFGQTTTFNGRYFIIRVEPPANETKLRISVTDKYDNVTEDTLPISSIRS